MAARSIAWSSILDCTERGPRANLSNAVAVLQHDPAWGPGVLWYDEFLDRIFIASPSTGAPTEWRDEDTARLTTYMQKHVGLSLIGEAVVASAARYVASQRTRHVVRDWLAALTWDQEPRIASALEDYWGVDCDESQPCEYVRAASQNFFIGLVARIFSPGCQLDTMLVFEGGEGIRKTSALRALASEPWYTAQHESVSRKDFFEVLRGKWIIEIAELNAFSRAEATRVKTVVSTPTDRYRPSYGRVARDFPRQCVFAGSTNKDDWGNDDTGLRRFWPIRCGTVDLPALREARAQLLAEAVSLFRAGTSWWEMPAVTLQVQADRQSESAWTPLVVAGLMGQSETTIAEVLMRILRHDASQISRPAELIVARILRLAGWKKVVRRYQGMQRKTWVAPLDG